MQDKFTTIKKNSFPRLMVC